MTVETRNAVAHGDGHRPRVPATLRWPSPQYLRYRWHVDRTSDRPLWKQLADQVRALVLAGTLRPDDLISQVSIRRQTGVSRSTIHFAMRQLEREGVVQMRRHVGTVVAGTENGEPGLRTGERLGGDDSER